MKRKMEQAQQQRLQQGGTYIVQRIHARVPES
jgi:hypothetical protein